MEKILKLKKLAAGAALAAATVGLAGCYTAPAYYGPRGYAYAAPAPGYGYYHYRYYGRPYAYGYYR
jgi:hypothetical protein